MEDVQNILRSIRLALSQGGATHAFTCFGGVPDSSDGKESACIAGDTRLILGSGRSPDGGGNLLQYSCLENPMDRGAWQATIHGVAKSWTLQSD